jgi:hypothetical protein
VPPSVAIRGATAVNIDAIETELRTLLSDLQLRSTLERADRIGQLLAEARPHVSHGQWVGWLKKLKLNRQRPSRNRAFAVPGVAGIVPA